MKRKTSQTPTRVMSYGCPFGATENTEVVREQLAAAHRYYNQLIELERKRRTEFRIVRSNAVGDVATLEADIAAIGDQIEEQRRTVKNKSQKARKRAPVDPAVRKRIKTLQERRKGLTTQLRHARKQFTELLAPADKAQRERITAKIDKLEKPPGPRIRERINAEVLDAMMVESEWSDVWKDVKRIEAAASSGKKAARRESGLTPGNYLLVEKAVEAAARAPVDPSFRRRFDGTGRVGVQCHREKITDVMSGQGTMIQIDPLPADQWETRSKRRKAYTKVRIRVGSDGRKPIWAEFPVLIHRKPPDDGVLMWAWVLVRRCGPKLRYELQLTIESSSFGEHRCGTGTVALDLGWRAVETGVRVGYCYDDRGHRRELVLTNAVREAFALADRLRGYSDQHFNTARAALAGYLKSPAKRPAWMAEETAHIHAWRAHGRLARVAGRWHAEAVDEALGLKLWTDWKTGRIACEQDLFASFDEISSWLTGRMPSLTEEQRMALFLEWWRRKNRHLYSWESNNRRKAIARRRDIYRNWAAQIASQYEHVVVEKFDLRKLARNSAPEEESSSDYTHRIQKDAAPSELRQAILNAVGPERINELPAKDTTRECALCGHINDWDRAEKLVQQCAGCGAEWDQDYNAAQVILRRYLEGGAEAA